MQALSRGWMSVAGRLRLNQSDSNASTSACSCNASPCLIRPVREEKWQINTPARNSALFTRIARAFTDDSPASVSILRLQPARSKLSAFLLVSCGPEAVHRP
jgi:hypothetical protein